LGLTVWKWLLILLLIYSIILGWGVFDIGSQFFMPTFWKGKKGKITFTFDDGPNAEITPKILQVLKEENIKATFFVIGKNIEKNSKLTQRIFDEGHVIGNHSYSHLYVFTKKKAIEQFTKGQEEIEKVIKKKPMYFRPPFGVMNPKISNVVQAANCTVIGWDLRSQDGRIRTAQATVNRVKSHLKKTTVLLFHDTNPTTPQALKEIIQLCRQNKIEIVSLPDISGIEPFAPLR